MICSPGCPVGPVPLTRDQRGSRASTWHFSFDLCMSDVYLGGPLLLNPYDRTLNAAKRISYAVHSPMPGDSQANVTGFIAGKQLRGSTVENRLTHTAILRLHLTPVEGERTTHPKIIELLIFPPLTFRRAPKRHNRNPSRLVTTFAWTSVSPATPPEIKAGAHVGPCRSLFPTLYWVSLLLARRKTE